MHPSKAPGPDGMTPLFFQKFWPIVKNDVLNAILGILNKGHDPRYLNHTHIVLIPKVKLPVTPKDFRPISHCNVVFRVITKTISNRLKGVLSSVISEAQSAFIHGRVITDNGMCAFEIFHTMRNKKKGKIGHIAMKLDMSQAIDRVEGKFLEMTMLKIGFRSNWVEVIMRCVTTVSYSVLVNGSPTSVINPERGIRQGNPLSLYLFFMCVKAFTTLL